MPPEQTSNPFAGRHMYINQAYGAEAVVAVEKSKTDAAYNARINGVAGAPTAVWLDDIAAISGGADGSFSLDKHLNETLKQSNITGKQAILTLVVYNLPGRDCAAKASNGELALGDLLTYKNRYVDAIYAVLNSNPLFREVEVVLIIEPDSLPNLITNVDIPACAAAQKSGVYVEGITYAIEKLGSLPNVHTYLDIGHSGWLGWPASMDQAVTLYADLIKAIQSSGTISIRGLATNVANYIPLVEPFLQPSNQSVLSSTFYEYNPIFDESTYVKTLSSKFSEAGLPDLGFVIDTGRNGWKVVDNGQPIDQRPKRGSWCNIKNAGIGDLPTISPRSDLPMLDAILWIKPPGESDGGSSPALATVGNKRFDPSCDPSVPANDAFENAPAAGRWFNYGYQQLMINSNALL